jgi:putative transposase
MMETFRKMVNECTKIGLANDISSMKKLSQLTYKCTAKYNLVNYYRLCAISHAAGILANRKKSIKRGLQPRQPYATKPLLVSCYGFKITDGIWKVPLGHRQHFDIPLNRYVRKVLSDPSIRIRSFTLTADAVSVCYSKDIAEIECSNIQGVDRNLGNLTVGNQEQVRQYDLTKAVDIAENTRSIMCSFKRNDVRVRRILYSKYSQRRKNRISQLLHHVSKAVVQQAKQDKTAIAFERLTYIRRLYQRGNYRSRAYRGRLNGWSFAEIKRQIGYKAAWEGMPIIQLSVKDTRGTSKLCPQCGKKITQVDRKTRQLWCAYCKKWMDRDMVAAMNLSVRGLTRFASSQGAAGEAMKGNPTTPVILRVDAAKLCLWHQSKT